MERGEGEGEGERVGRGCGSTGPRSESRGKRRRMDGYMAEGGGRGEGGACSQYQLLRTPLPAERKLKTCNQSVEPTDRKVHLSEIFCMKIEIEKIPLCGYSC